MHHVLSGLIPGCFSQPSLITASQSPIPPPPPPLSFDINTNLTFRSLHQVPFPRDQQNRVTLLLLYTGESLSSLNFLPLPRSTTQKAVEMVLIHTHSVGQGVGYGSENPPETSLPSAPTRNSASAARNMWGRVLTRPTSLALIHVIPQVDSSCFVIYRVNYTCRHNT